MAHFDPNRSDFSPYGFNCVRWTPSRMPRCDRHDEIELNLLDRGMLVYLIGGERVSIPAGRLCVFWAGIPHQIIEFAGLTEYFVLTVPLAWFLQWRLPAHLTQPILHGQMVVEPDAARLAWDWARFDAWSEDARMGTEKHRHICLLEIEARLRRLALTIGDAPPHPRWKTPSVLGSQHLSRAEQMACYIARHYAKPLTVEMIGHHVGLHPNYAMGVFQRAFGTTLLKYVNQHRLSHAQRLLVTTDDLVLDIALKSGFGSLSRFNEAFRQSFGCTPREYRKLNQLD